MGRFGALMLLAACSSASEPASPAPAAPSVPEPEEQVEPDVELDVRESEAEAPPLLAVGTFRPVGIDEVRFHVTFEDGSQGTFLPAETRRPRRAHHEVAAAKLAFFVGVNDADTFKLRRFSEMEIEAALDEAARPAWAELRRSMEFVEDEVVGALGPWEPDVRDLRRTQPERLDGMTARLLGMERIDASEVSLYAELSEMVLFDHLVGVRGRRILIGSDDQLRLVGNAAAFPQGLPFEQQRLLRRDLMRVRRFPGRFLERLRALDRTELDTVLADDGIALLTEPERRGLQNRRDAILSYARSWIEQSGESEIVVFR